MSSVWDTICIITQVYLCVQCNETVSIFSLGSQISRRRRGVRPRM